MALRFVDGCDTYSTAQLQTGGRIYSGNPGGNFTVSASGGRFGGQAISQNAALNQSQYLTVPLDNQATWIIGGWFKYTTQLAGTIYHIWSLWDTATCQLSVGHIDNTLVIYRGQSTGTLLCQSAAILSLNTGFYIETKLTVNNAAGLAEVRVNGSGVAAATFSGNTRASANNSANLVRLSFDGNGANSSRGMIGQYDDVWICDGTTALNNSYLGDKRIYTLSPSGAGANTQLTANGAATNWQAVSENPADDDTSYVFSSTANQKDTYAMSDLAAGVVNVSGVAVRLAAKKTDAGARSITPLLRSAGTDYTGTTQVLQTTYTSFQQVWQTDPATSAAWAFAAVNAAEAGVRVD